MAFKEEIVITATDEASPSIDKATTSLKTMSETISLEKFEEKTKSIRDFGIALITDFVGGAMEAERAALSLEVALNRNAQAQQTATISGYDWVVMGKQDTEQTNAKLESYKQLATELQSISVLEDDSILQAAALFESNDKINQSTQEYIKILPDLAGWLETTTGRQYTAVDAARELILGVEGSSRVFNRYGLELKDASNNFVGAEEAIKRITIVTEGQAEVALKSDHGIRQMQNAWGNFKEDLGAQIIPILDRLVKEFLLPVIDLLNSMPQWLKQGTAEFLIFGTAIAAVATAGAGVAIFFTSLSAAAVTTIGWVVGITSAAVALYEILDKLFELVGANQALQSFFEMFMNYESVELKDKYAAITEQRQPNLYNNIADAQDEQENYIVPDGSITAENLFG